MRKNDSPDIRQVQIIPGLQGSLSSQHLTEKIRLDITYVLTLSSSCTVAAFIG